MVPLKVILKHWDPRAPTRCPTLAPLALRICSERHAFELVAEKEDRPVAKEKPPAGERGEVISGVHTVDG